MTDRSAIPLLESQRLRLRAHAVGDFSASFAMWSDPKVTRFIGGNPSTEQQTWTRLMSYLGHWALMDFGYWLVEEKTTGAFIGEVGFADFKRDLEPSIREFAEMGWALTPSMHGKGYALEAIQTALAWAGTHLPVDSIACLISPDNHRSLKVAGMVGFEQKLRTTFAGEPTYLFTRPTSLKPAITE